MSNLLPIAPGVHASTSELRLPLGLPLPVRMTVLGVAGGVVLVSPLPMDSALEAQINALGPVRAIVAPNLLHHLFLADAKKRWPTAPLIGPRALATKRSDLVFDRFLEDMAVDAAGGARGESSNARLEGIEVLPISGAPSIAEHLFLHNASRTLVATDFLFNIRSAGFMTRLVLTVLSGAYGGPKQSRLWRFAIKDRQAAAESVGHVLARDFDRLVVAHGEVLEQDAKAALLAATAWLNPTPLLAPAA